MDSLFREGSLGSILFKSQIITEKDIETALAEQKKTGLRFGESLVKLGIVRQEDIDWALSNQLDIPYVRINKETVDPAVLDLVPAFVARHFKIFPIVRIGNELRVAIADPLDTEAIAEVERVSGCTVSISMGLLQEIIDMQNHFYGDAEEMEPFGFSSPCFPAKQLSLINGDHTGAELLDGLLRHMMAGLSSVSLKPLQERVTVSGRRGSACEYLGKLPILHYERFLATLRKRAGITWSNGVSSSGTLPLSVGDEQVPFQVSLVQAAQGEYVTLRPLLNSTFPKNIASLETTERNRKVLQRLATLSGGIVFFSSLDAEERARLMGACLEEYAGSAKNVLVIGKGFHFCGDRFPVLPVDRDDAGIDKWIRAALLHDPGVLAIEEIVEASAFKVAFDAVVTGTVLFCGVAAPGVRPVLNKLLSLRDRLPMLPMALGGIIAGQGVHILCSDCKEKDSSPVPNPLRADSTPRLFFRARGCTSCSYTGYAAKRYLVETALFDEELTEIFNRSGGTEEIMAQLIRKGFQSMVEEAGGLLDSGEITVQDFISVATKNGARQWPE